MPRILIVDDEPALRRTYERALRPHGFEVTAVGDPHLAYELLETAEHDLVLLDIHLPGLAGDALYLALARRWPRLAGRVVVSSPAKTRAIAEARVKTDKAAAGPTPRR